MMGWWVLFLAGIFLSFLGTNWYKASYKTSDGRFREMKDYDKLFWSAIMTPVGILFITTFALAMRVPIIGHPVFI
ncbi:MAG: hypothetical protein HZB99_00775 [Candidatus Harrisonbacteria bacterium]|nr:hypothetical protein [Candidatus Harrisonbacteria bacterium]